MLLSEIDLIHSGRLHPQRADLGAVPDPAPRPSGRPGGSRCTVLAKETHGGAAGADETLRHLG